MQLKSENTQTSHHIDLISHLLNEITTRTLYFITNLFWCWKHSFGICPKNIHKVLKHAHFALLYLSFTLLFSRSLFFFFIFYPSFSFFFFLRCYYCRSAPVYNSLSLKLYCWYVVVCRFVPFAITFAFDLGSTKAHAHTEDTRSNFLSFFVSIQSWN